MATKKRNTQYDAKKAGEKFVGFVNYTLTKDDKAAYEKWAEGKTLEDAFSEIERLVDSFYTFSLKHDNFGGGVQCNLKCANEGEPDYGLVLTARAPDVFNAIMLALWKHVVLFAGGWYPWFVEKETKSMWG